MTEINSLDELKAVLVEGDTTVVVLTQPATCVPCRRLKPHLTKLEERGRNVAVVDLDTVPEAMVEFAVQSVPKVLLVRDGGLVKELVGRTSLQLDKEID